MKSILIIALCCIMTSCIKEELTNYSAYIENPLQHRIEIKPFKGGFSKDTDLITLSPGVIFKIAEGFDRGKNNGGGFNSEYLIGTDSIVVIFDSLYKAVHFINNTDSTSGNYYSYSSKRNLGNYESYHIEKTDETKHSITFEYIYKFTEEDYNYAQNSR
jgi:hypothetical protein